MPSLSYFASLLIAGIALMLIMPGVCSSSIRENMEEMKTVPEEQMKGNKDNQAEGVSMTVMQETEEAQKKEHPDEEALPVNSDEQMKVSIDDKADDVAMTVVKETGEARQNEPTDTSDKNELENIDTVDHTGGGVVYTRWGRSQCPSGAQLVYSGTAAGSYYYTSTYTGGGSNYLCLPSQPIYDEVYSSTATVSAYLYSSEYRTSSGPSRLRSVNYHTPTCAVCLAPSGYTNQLMVPGRNDCPSAEWRLEYKGYLMAERYSHYRSKFICMDRDMEAESGTQGSQGGAYFYFVEARCIEGGGLPCGPYKHGYELTCAVCTI